jgi:dihydroorotase
MAWQAVSSIRLPGMTMRLTFRLEPQGMLDGPETRKRRSIPNILQGRETGLMLTRRDFAKTVFTTGTGLLAAGNAWPAGKPPAFPAQSTEASGSDCDLLIKGGTVVDPSQHLHEPMDVAVKNGKILEVSKHIPESRAEQVFSAKDRIVTPGFIDLHVHCFYGIGPAINADHYCLGRGVTTVVDAGSAGYFEMGIFVNHIIRPSITRIYPLMHIKATGTTANSIKYRSATGKIERDIPDWQQPELAAKAAMEFRPYVVGIKTRIGEDVQGNTEELDCLRMTLKAAELTQMPAMVHLDEMYTPLPEFLKLMRKGDTYTHFINSHKNSILDDNGKIIPAVLEARERGILFDVGEGNKPGRFSFDVAEKCLQQGFPPDTISTDLGGLDVTRVVYDLPTVASKFLAIGMDLDSVIACVTINPTKAFDFGVQLGTLRPGSEADIGIFELQEGSFTFLDNVGGPGLGEKGTGGQKRVGRQRLVNHAVVCRGQLYVNEV